MIILKLYGIFFIIVFIIEGIKLFKPAYDEVIREEKEEQRALYAAYERERDASIERERKELAAEYKRKEERNELQQQIDALQYQLKLLEKLDNFRSDRLDNEKDVKKALALEKQYNTLYTKERKLKAKLKELD